ncbi:tyrosine-type recombinase/integrase [Brevibacillus choshinensis]|uniref:Tyrosine-type recombinase/integrase n=1 Tax=Brevibacillus choshinensis TaxID=54911 RepID=A0ABX7FJQ3_BRECH|nr:tyrosine-type recombinase/integrase [Brevibacillus choshinensis]QRG66008.1 tyrosine-type recombinase/integrase [Brevibacillus choshinensis]
MLLKFAIKDFRDDREYKNLSSRTIENYLGNLQEFHDYCVGKSILNVTDVTQNTIKEYLLYCQREKKNNITTSNSKLHVLKIFFNYLQEIEVITEKENPTKRMKYGKEEIKIEVFQDSHIKKMLGYYQRIKQREKSFYAYRDYTIIVFLLGTGVRLGELVNLRWSDINMVSGTITVWGKKRQQSSIPITDKLMKELCEYKVFCQQVFGRVSDYVFTTTENEKLSENALKFIFKRLKTIMNFTDVRLSTHTFRHSFAHRMLMNGCDVFTLQKMLRHNNIAMTQRYLAIWGTALKEQNDRYNPLNNIII